MSVATYYGKLNALWKELAHHEPLITCSCCTNCKAGELHAQRREASRLHDFLMGQHSEFYSQLRANILSQDPLPSFDYAFHLAVQDERVRQAKTQLESKSSDAVGFALRAEPSVAGRGRGRGDRTPCIHCKKVGHESASCYSLLFCTHCNKRGHDVNGCYELHGNNGSSTSSSPSQIFPAEQWKAIEAVVVKVKVPENRLNGPNGEADWNGSYTGWTVLLRRSHFVQHISANGATSQLALWHKRMGHPSKV
ncbi:uncharacterized protein LOC110704386 [Chenopodium quinoa]|uniref:uncharacterized protein LOC110704386 n=1 Tax=Chenopodium quinoa TaxID=63459 RepID=UPI000B78CF28|nr:uncharacterized protein LOC110704386 [Chenopodium quinoa]